MNYKIAMVPILILLLLGSAFAAVTVTINSPTSGELFTPNLVSSDQVVVFDFNVVDSNIGGSVHIATLMYDFGDGNTFVFQDRNLSTSNCSFLADDIWSTNGGAHCKFTYRWRTHSPVTANNYAFDLNVSSGNVTTGNEVTVIGQDLITLSIDNRFIDSSTETMLNVISIVLMAAVLVVAALALVGKITGTTVLVTAVMAMTAVIVIVVLTIVIDTLTP